MGVTLSADPGAAASSERRRPRLVWSGGSTSRGAGGCFFAALVSRRRPGARHRGCIGVEVVDLSGRGLVCESDDESMCENAGVDDEPVGACVRAVMRTISFRLAFLFLSFSGTRRGRVPGSGTRPVEVGWRPAGTPGKVPLGGTCKGVSAGGVAPGRSSVNDRVSHDEALIAVLRDGQGAGVGISSNASTWAGRTTRKSRWSSVAIVVAWWRSARAMTLASAASRAMSA